jgi:hypothetical protein
VERTGWRRTLRNPRVLIVLVLLLLAILIGGAVLSFTVFTTSSQNTGTISAGNLVFDLVPSGSFVDTSGLRPGDTRTGSLEIANRESGATFTLGFAGLDPNPLRDVLQLKIDQTAPVSRQLYSGPLKDVTPIVLGRIETGSSIQLGFSFVWPSDQRAPQLQGQNVPLVLQWSATT